MSRLAFHRPEGFEHLVSETPGPGHWFVYRGDRLLVELGPPLPGSSDDPRVLARPGWARLPFGEVPRLPEGLTHAGARALPIGLLHGVRCHAIEAAAEAAAPPGMAWENLRTLFSVLDDAHFAIAGRALQLVDWDRTHRYCGRCASPTETKVGEHVRVCPACQLAVYPRLAPAVMALVRRGRELLLARGAHFPAGMYSALAGFVEPGESLEQCVRREVAEEVGVEVGNIAYFASQPWPFPHSLMIAFTCDWIAGEICPREGEIEAANWFEVFQLPRLPSKISIARRLIDDMAMQMRRTFQPGDQP
ncbi:MAG: NAD(+) diphosphatase [Betaproteobacteria bacterium]|nr:NAD(+) diphosphatase [Betaproteobacteria bacterium]